MTAKEMFDKMLEENDETTSTEMMVAFAEMHVQLALKEASGHVEGFTKIDIVTSYMDKIK